ncbi:hypothetical protein [Catelliglobosispora koreensis]|uniref:hypothetical protein n=1 Tax=Catelliglobosispora koreensis TaxID=129052 RepID=UPI000363EA53|nr:hypothetical protein [Catelliglobosispora koreensis]
MTDIDILRANIARRRAELAVSLSALAARADVPLRLAGGAQRTVAQGTDAARRAGAHFRQHQTLWVAGAVIGLLALVIIARRRR